MCLAISTLLDAERLRPDTPLTLEASGGMCSDEKIQAALRSADEHELDAFLARFPGAADGATLEEKGQAEVRIRRKPAACRVLHTIRIRRRSARRAGLVVHAHELHSWKGTSRMRRRGVQKKKGPVSACKNGVPAYPVCQARKKAVFCFLGAKKQLRKKIRKAHFALGQKMETGIVIGDVHHTSQKACAEHVRTLLRSIGVTERMGRSGAKRRCALFLRAVPEAPARGR